jgi:hypothetical protein
MTRLLESGSADFEIHFEQLLGDKREQSADVNDAVAAILSDVRGSGVTRQCASTPKSLTASACLPQVRG